MELVRDIANLRTIARIEYFETVEHSFIMVQDDVMPLLGTKRNIVIVLESAVKRLVIVVSES